MNPPNDTRPLRVCMVVHAYYHGDARVRRYAESLAAAGHQVDVLALRRPGSPRRDVAAGVNILQLPPARRRGGVLRYLYEYCAFTFLAFWVLAFRARRYDIVHAHNMPDFLVFAGLLPRLFGARTVLDVHDLMPEVYCSKFHCGLGHPAIWPIRLQEWISHRFASAVVFATEQFRSRAVARRTVRKEESIVVMNAPDTKLFDRKIHPWCGPQEPGAFHLLYLGTISHRHGVDQCVRVLPLLRERIPGIRLVVHSKLSEGEGKPLAELQALAKELGVEDLVHLRDPVPLQDVPTLIRRASVGVFTPHLDVHIDMALSLKVPEFVAMDLPIVAVRTSIMTSLFAEDEVLMFPDGDMPAFAECLWRIHQEPGLREGLVQRSKRFLVEHSWEREFAGYAELLGKLTGRQVLPAAARG